MKLGMKINYLLVNGQMPPTAKQALPEFAIAKLRLGQRDICAHIDDLFGICKCYML